MFIYMFCYIIANRFQNIFIFCASINFFVQPYALFLGINLMQSNCSWSLLIDPYAY